jgi:hypothetical protein
MLGLAQVWVTAVKGYYDILEPLENDCGKGWERKGVRAERQPY